jgi:hypothetical protein
MKITIVKGFPNAQTLYVDGEWKRLGEPLDVQEVLQILGFEVSVKQADLNWLYDKGFMPDRLEDVEIIIKK